VPGAGNPQAWNRYAYVLYNPLRYIDPSGYWVCDENGICYISGWDDKYMSKQKGNTCAVVSIAAGLSILTKEKYTQQDIQPLFPATYFWIGVWPEYQAAMLNFDPKISAEYTQGTRDELKENLIQDIVTVVTFALPLDEGVGHVLLLIGYNQNTDEFIFFNPASGRKEDEEYIAEYYSEKYGYEMTFDELWEESNEIVNNNAMVTIQIVEPNYPYPSAGVPNASRGGRSDWVFYRLR